MDKVSFIQPLYPEANSRPLLLSLQHKEEVREFAGVVRETDRVGFRMLVFTNPSDGVAFLELSGANVQGEPFHAAVFPHSRRNRTYFATVVFLRPPTLCTIAHEAVHLASEYRKRLGHKLWVPKDPQVCESPEEQIAYATGSITRLITHFLMGPMNPFTLKENN